MGLPGTKAVAPLENNLGMARASNLALVALLAKRKKKETDKLKCTKDGIGIRRSPLDKLEEVRKAI